MKMADELKAFAKSQLKRLTHLQGFPKHSEAIADYIAALEVAKTPDRIRSVVDAFVGDAESTQCPTAAMIRRMAYDKAEADTERRRGCSLCDGTGFSTIWYIVTYQGKSFVIKKSERIPGGYEDAMRLARVLSEPLAGADRQQVITAAKDCQCRKAA